MDEVQYPEIVTHMKEEKSDLIVWYRNGMIIDDLEKHRITIR